MNRYNHLIRIVLRKQKEKRKIKRRIFLSQIRKKTDIFMRFLRIQKCSKSAFKEKDLAGLSFDLNHECILRYLTCEM